MSLEGRTTFSNNAKDFLNSLFNSTEIAFCLPNSFDPK